MLSTRFDNAFSYARQLHHAQTRKGTTIPYISHLMSVSALVIEHGGNEDHAIAALLHDAAEDQGGSETLNDIRKRFGNAVAQIVSDCTDAWIEPKPEWRPRKEAYLAKLPTKPLQSTRRTTPKPYSLTIAFWVIRSGIGLMEVLRVHGGTTGL